MFTPSDPREFEAWLKDNADKSAMDDLKNHPMMQPLVLSPKEAEIRAWLKENRLRLAGYEKDEIVYRATLCVPCTTQEACQAVSNDQDGFHLDSRAAFQVWRVQEGIDEFNRIKADLEKPKKFDLMPLWKDLTMYQTGD